MNEILINIISVIVTTVVIPLISILGGKLVSLINSKISNEKASNLLTTATNCVINAVRTVLQTYVDTLKAEGKFNEASQKLALMKAKDIALNQMSEEVKVYIENTYGNLDVWLTTQIEATINILKNR